MMGKLDFVHLGGVGEDVCELSVNCGWGFSAVGFQPRQCNISGHAIGKIDGRKELIDELLRYDPTQHLRDDQGAMNCCKACEGMMAIVEIIAAQRMQRRDDQDEAPAE